MAQHHLIEVVAATADIDFGSGALPTASSASAESSTPSLPRTLCRAWPKRCEQREVAHLLVLDDRLHEGRLAGLLELPMVSYLTRQAGLDALITAIMEIAESGGSHVRSR